jgi:maltose O-acetyltransferase
VNGYSRVVSILDLIRKRKRTKYLAGLVRNGLRLGTNVHIVDTFFFDPSHCFLISIGNRCTICPNVRLIAHDASTKQFLGYTKIGRIDIKENCFIGDSVVVLPGVMIGPNAIVGAGSVVTKDIPPGTIAAGNPAKVISTLEAYLGRIEEIRKNKRVFNQEYFIERLTEEKRQEIMESIGDTIGFIV